MVLIEVCDMVASNLSEGVQFIDCSIKIDTPDSELQNLFKK